MTALPLAGSRVLVTRAAHQAGKLSEGLRALGIEPVEVAVIEIRPPLDFAPLDRALRSLSNYDWLILTSANTVCALTIALPSIGLDRLPLRPQSRCGGRSHSSGRARRRLGRRIGSGIVRRRKPREEPR